MSLDYEKVAEKLRAGTFKNCCDCHYCTGERKRSDGYCARCDVKIETSVPWEDMPVCERCDADIWSKTDKSKWESVP